MKSRTLDFLTVGSSVIFVQVAFAMLFYFVWSKLDPSMEKMWSWKRHYYLLWLIGSLIVALPCWFVLIKRRRRKRAK